MKAAIIARDLASRLTNASRSSAAAAFGQEKCTVTSMPPVLPLVCRLPDPGYAVSRPAWGPNHVDLLRRVLRC
jgi:hypothetical protein